MFKSGLSVFDDLAFVACNSAFEFECAGDLLFISILKVVYFKRVKALNETMTIPSVSR